MLHQKHMAADQAADLAGKGGWQHFTIWQREANTFNGCQPNTLLQSWECGTAWVINRLL